MHIWGIGATNPFAQSIVQFCQKGKPRLETPTGPGQNWHTMVTEPKQHGTCFCATLHNMDELPCHKEGGRRDARAEPHPAKDHPCSGTCRRQRSVVSSAAMVGMFRVPGTLRAPTWDAARSLSTRGHRREVQVPELTQQMVQVLKQQPVILVATSDGQGRPNVSPKGALKIVDGNKLVFADLFSLKTRANLQANPSVAVAAVDPQTYEGYQFKGWAELVEEGPLFEEMAGLLARGRNGPQPMELWFEKAARELMAALGRAGRNGIRPSHAVVLHIEEIWNLAPGHEGEVWR